METLKTAEEVQQFLTFHIAGEEYAAGITRVREIIEYDTVTRVPKTHDFIRGVINLRGGVVPVIDLAVKFGLPESSVTRSTCIVVLELVLNGETTTMGIVADSVSQVVDLTPADIEKVPSFGTRVNTDYLLGMAKLGKKFALILDVDRVLSLEELEKVAAVEKGELQQETE
jgi:purine-binding chemotaxis protein CheW